MLSKVCNVSKEMLQVAILTENMRLSAMIDVVKTRLSKNHGEEASSSENFYTFLIFCFSNMCNFDFSLGKKRIETHTKTEYRGEV